MTLGSQQEVPHGVWCHQWQGHSWYDCQQEAYRQQGLGLKKPICCFGAGNCPHLTGDIRSLQGMTYYARNARWSCQLQINQTHTSWRSLDLVVSRSRQDMLETLGCPLKQSDKPPQAKPVGKPSQDSSLNIICFFLHGCHTYHRVLDIRIIFWDRMRTRLTRPALLRLPEKLWTVLPLLILNQWGGIQASGCDVNRVQLWGNIMPLSALRTFTRHTLNL